ncbi:MAG: hypothetical protein KDB60_11290, partial [Propionibacteriaceae bacterium]|nr:hypothetical protein [Propionibacteriaceae bacterium]
RWRWRDLLLDESPAVLIWTPETQKANRREEIVICDELAALLAFVVAVTASPAIVARTVASQSRDRAKKIEQYR